MSDGPYTPESHPPAAPPAAADRSLGRSRGDLARRQIETLLVFYAVGAGLITMVALAVGDSRSVVVAAVNLLACIVLWTIARHGHLQSAALLTCAALLATGCYTTLTSAFGILDSTAGIFALVALYAATLLERTWLMSLVVGAALLAVLLIGNNHLLQVTPDDSMPRIIPIDPVVVMVLVMLTAVCVRRQNHYLWTALAHSWEQEQDLAGKRDQLADESARARASEERWRTLARAAPQWILQLDPDGRVVFTNRDGLGPDGDPVGLALTSIVTAPCRRQVAEALQQVADGRETAPLDAEIIVPEHSLSCALNFGPLHDGGTLIGIMVMVTDETVRRRLREELHQAQRLDSLGRLAGGIAHDFNNLLTVISGHAELADECAAAGEPVAEDLGMIRQATDRAAELTGQILAFGRRQTMHPRPLDLNREIAGSRRMLRRLIGADLDLVEDPAPLLPPVLADRSQLEQVLVNLVINARDAIRERAGGGPGTIRLATRCLPAPPGACDDPTACGCTHVELAVSDTGVGIPDEVRERIFEPFFSTKEVGQGTGLGLAVVHGIVHQSGGTIGIESVPGRGTTVRVALKAAPAGSGVTAEAEADAAVPAAGRGEHVLLVEDDPGVRELAVAALRGFGYRVTACRDAEEARSAFKAAGDIAALVTDVVMPGDSGFDLARDLPPDLPVIFTSGYAEGEWRDRTETRARRSRFLPKPYRPRDLARGVRALLDGATA